MTALSSRRRGWPTNPPAGNGLKNVVSLLATGLGGSAGAAAIACGGVLVARRLVLPAAEPAPAALPVVAAAAAALVALADVSFRLGGSWAATIAARVGTAVVIAALALPLRTATWNDAVPTALACAIAVGAIAFAPRPAQARPPRPGGRPPRRPGVRPRRPAEVERLPGRLRQRFTRYESTAGVDNLRGRVVVGVTAGSKTAHGHVGFCPAFAVTPAVEVSTDYDGVEATVAAAEVLPWGLRVEVRLAEPAEEPLEIPVDVVVRGAG
jgi:hypothetical protein